MSIILLVSAFILSLLAALLWQAPAEPYRLRLLALGIACFFLHLIIGAR